MEFKPENVYYALNADESLIGAKGYFSDSLSELTNVVTHDFLTSYYSVLTENHKHGFIMKGQNHIFNFFYLVEPASEKWYVFENNFVLADGKIIYEIVKNTWAYEGEPLFSGSKEECNQWIKEHSKPKYRPFKDCDELIKCYIDNCYKKQMSPNPNNFINEWIELPTIWVKSKSDGRKDLITSFNTKENYICVDSYDCTFDELLNNYTFLDGSVCGAEEVWH